MTPYLTRPIRTGLAMALITTVASGAPVLAADAEPLVGDRPDFTESAVTIAPGRVQIEAGATLASEGGTDVTEVGEVLVRVGLLPWLESRLGLGSWSGVDAPGGEQDGFTDLELGAKLALLKGAATVPTLALLASSTLPTGAEGVGSEEAEPAVILAAEWELTDRVGVGSNLGWTRPHDGRGRHDSLWLSTAVGVALDARWSWFLEGYGFDQEEDHGPSTGYVDTGVTYQVHGDLQLDLRVGKGFRGEADDWSAGAGVVLRI